MGPSADAPPRRWAAMTLIASVALLLALPSFVGATAFGPADLPAPAAGVSRLLAAPVVSGAIPASPQPQVTTLYDWDPQPFIVGPTFPLDLIAGEGASMVTSDRYGTVLLFGGISPFGLSNTTVVANETTGSWAVVGGPSPPPLTNASLAVSPDGRLAVLFGGEADLVTEQVVNQTWVFSFVNDSWSNATRSVAPPPRESAAFAVDTQADVGLLEGGWEPAASVGGNGATVIWNDTWELNLTTLNWSRVTDPTAPRPMYASSLVYDPVAQLFFLFGGCPGIGICSSTLFEYGLGGNWSRVAATGDLPPARGAASMVWSSTWEFAMMFGGFQFGGNSYLPLNDSYIYSPGIHEWDLVAGAGPEARFGAAASFLAANGCPGFLVVGGSYALQSPPPDGWFADANPDIGSGCNVWGGDQAGGTTGPPPGPCTPILNVTLQLQDVRTRHTVPNGSVELIGKCGTLRLATNPNGTVIVDLPNENVTITGQAALYHQTTLVINVTSLIVPRVVVLLTHLPQIIFFAWGITFPDVQSPLGEVLIGYEQGIVGATGPNGGYSDPGFNGPQGPVTFVAARPYYSNTSAVGTVPYTGNLTVNFTLLADGQFDIRAQEYPDGTGIANATGVLASVGAYAYGGSVYFKTGPTGWYNLTLPQANYTVFLGAPGFVSNQTPGPVFHPWLVSTNVTLDLFLDYGSNVSVHLVDAHTHLSIASGYVVLGIRPVRNTTATGWVNYTDVLPPGLYNVSGAAAGYRSNSTAVLLTYLVKLRTVTLNLTPEYGCPSTGCNGTGGGVNLTGYSLLPPPGAALQLFVVAPLILAIAAAIYIGYLRRASLEGRTA